MFYVENDVINLTRGDDAVLVVPLTTDEGEAYTLTEEEYLTFGVRELPDEGSELLIEIQSQPGSNDIPIAHEDTDGIPPGFYSAEVQLMTRDRQRVTVWPKLTGNARTSLANRRNFCLMTEVVCS